MTGGTDADVDPREPAEKVTPVGTLFDRSGAGAGRLSGSERVARALESRLRVARSVKAVGHGTGVTRSYFVSRSPLANARIARTAASTPIELAPMPVPRKNPLGPLSGRPLR